MSSVTDSDNNIGGLEKITTLWKQYNNLINTKPSSYAANEEVPFKNYVINNDIFNQNVPENILISEDISLNIILPNNQTIEFIITTNDFSYITIENLDTLFDNCNNILPGSKCNFENLGYKHIEYYYKKECYPTIYNTTTQIYTWYIPDPSNGNISNSNTKNLLKNTIAFLYDPYNNTYKYRLYYKLSGNFYSINFASSPDYAYLDNKSGFLYFYGGRRNNNNVELDNIRSQNDNDPSPPYISYIRYNGNTGFENLTMNGLINIDGSLNINNDLSFIDISENLYNVLNTKQIKEYVNSINISGGGSSLDLHSILKSNNDASFNNLDISGSLKINQQDVAIKNYIDNSFTQTTLFNDLSLNFNILDAQVQTICGANFALKINEISGDVIIIENDIISISGRIDNIKNIVNNLDVSYLTDSAFESSYNYLSNTLNTIDSSLVNIKNIVNNLDVSYLTDIAFESSYNYLSNTLNTIDSSLVNIQNNIENININNNISNKYNFHNIELLNTNSIVNIVNSKYIFNDSNTYDASKNYGLRTGNYVLKNVSNDHPIAILNNDVSNLITYNVIDNAAIIIKVSYGEFSSPYYIFNDASDNSINIDTFRFMRNRSYEFVANGISSSHPFKIFVNNAFTNAIDSFSGKISFTINNNHSLDDGTFFYQCNFHNSMRKNFNFLNNSVSGTTNDANYDFYYGDVSINVLGDFGNVSVYCYYHGYMGGENLLQYVSNFYTTKTNLQQDLSLLFFNTITPTKNDSNILININVDLFCSYALEERISIELWRDLSMLTKNNNLGSIIATGGLTLPYSLTYLDYYNSNNNPVKYYLKYILENNNSLQEMGLINIKNNSNIGSSNIILREI